MAARSTQPADSVLLAFDPVARAKDSRFNFSRYAHLSAILLLAGAIAGLAYLLINEDRAMQRDALNRDVDTLAQSLSLRLQAMTEAATSIALEIGDAKYNESRFASTGREFMMSKPELLHLSYVDGNSRVRWSVQSPNPLADWSRPAASEIGAEITSVIKRARDAHSTFFSPPYEDKSGPSSDNGSPFTDLVTPVFSDDRYVGAVLARVSLPELLRLTVKPELGQRYRIALRGEDGAVLAASTSGETPSEEPRYAVRVPLLSDGMTVQASPFRQRSRVLGNALSGLVVGLTLIVMVTLAALARRDVKQAQVERVLRTETAFRRAMEDSLATGMGVLDRHGVLRHVNQAFIQMTGWPAGDLIGRSPPFPYWPPERYAEYQAKLAIVLAGQAPASGFELKVLRRDGSMFDARTYFSALLADDGEQLAWMSSMADITESKRFSEQLAAAHERFTTVLESLDAAVSVVADDGGDELLFANRSYRDLYGPTSAGHRKWGAALPSNAVAGEIFDPEIARWFDVRTRYVRWVDGRDVLLQIATDITERKATEEIVRQQQEKVELTSRLMTMGEMASSLAHELNQPLTAISNYCLGAVSRMKEAASSTKSCCRPRENRRPGAARRQHHPAHSLVRETLRAEPPPHRGPAHGRRRGRFRRHRGGQERHRDSHRCRSTSAATARRSDPDRAGDAKPAEERGRRDGPGHGSARIELVVRRQDDMALFSVSIADSGDRACSTRICSKPFFSTKPEGMGMGLNICRSIVEFHHGRLTESLQCPDGGAIFVFTLPLADVNETISEADEELK